MHNSETILCVVEQIYIFPIELKVGKKEVEFKKSRLSCQSSACFASWIDNGSPTFPQNTVNSE